METAGLPCPNCGQPVTQNGAMYVCADHGEWMLYGRQLLVRRPTADDLRPERVVMPWEKASQRVA